MSCIQPVFPNRVFAEASMQWEWIAWIQTVSAQSLRRSLHAVGEHVLVSSSLHPQSLHRSLHAVEVHVLDSNSLCMQSSAKPTCSGSACLGFKQSPHRVFAKASMQWECMSWIQTASAQSLRRSLHAVGLHVLNPTVFGKDYMQCERMSWIQAVFSQHFSRSLLAVGVHKLDSSSLSPQSLQRRLRAIEVQLPLTQSLLIQSSATTTYCGSALPGFKQFPPTVSLPKSTCSGGVFFGFEQSLHRVFRAAY